MDQMGTGQKVLVKHGEGKQAGLNVCRETSKENFNPSRQQQRGGSRGDL